MPAIINAANEVAVEAFLAGKISFPDIVAVVSEAASAVGAVPAARTLEEAEGIDQNGRVRAREVIHRVARAAVAH
jgi:1-deoxy-D-xylulose-5-phosphate reductoisomerase